MENKNEFQSIILLSIIGIILSVFTIAADAIVSKINNTNSDAMIVLYIASIALGVLYLASSTTKKQRFLDAIHMVTNIVLVVFGAVIAIVEYVLFVNSSNFDYMYGIRFALGLVLMVVSILKLIYYFISRNNEAVRKIYKTITLTTLVILALYLVLFIVHESLISFNRNVAPVIQLFIYFGTFIIFTLATYLAPRLPVTIPEEETNEEIEVVNQEEDK